jgi:Polyketide cyclase / dehydrase and lipid transport
MFLAVACGLLAFSSFNASSEDRPSGSGPGGSMTATRSIITVETSIVIQRPTSQVFAFVSNAENDIQWRSEVVSMKNVTPAPHGAGTRTVEVAKVLGKQLETTTEIVEFVPDVRMSRRTLSSQTPVTTARSVWAVEGGTRFTYKLQADVTEVFMFRLFRPILEWWTQRKVEGYMAKLKEIMESPGAPPPL